MPKIKVNKKAIIQNKKKKKTVPVKSRASNPTLVRAVCSLTDPFCAHASGAKYPDNSSARTIPYSYRTRIQLTTDASGNGTVIMYPGFKYVPYKAGVMTGTVADFSVTPITSWDPFSGKTFRVVSMGMVIRHVGQPLYASGMLRVRGFASTDYAAYQTVDINTYYCDFSKDVPIQDTKEVTVVAKPLDPTSRNFFPTIQPSGTIYDFQTMPSFSPIVIGISGGQVSTTVCEIELFYHIEIVVADNNDTALLASAAPPFNPALATATSILTSTAENVFLGGVKAFGSYIERTAFQTISKLAGPAIISVL